MTSVGYSSRQGASLKHLFIITVVSSSVVPFVCICGRGFPEFAIDDEGGEQVKNTRRELYEQLYLWLHMAHDSRVLFIGGNIGTGCVFADKLLQEPSKSMCVEPMPNLATTLRQNQKKQNASFVVLDKLLSRPAQGNVSLVFKGFASHAALPGERVDYIVESVDLDLSRFNVLAADCEGCFCEIFRSFKEVADMELILLEEDTNQGYVCEGVDGPGDIYVFLRKAGFTKVNGAVPGSGHPRHSVWSKNPSPMMLLQFLAYHFTVASFVNGGAWLSLVLPEESASSINVTLSIIFPATCVIVYLAILGTCRLASLAHKLAHSK